MRARTVSPDRRCKQRAQNLQFIACARASCRCVAEISASRTHFALAVECPGWHSHSRWPNRRSQRRRPIPSDTKYLSTKQHISCRSPPPRLYSCEASSQPLFVSRPPPSTTTPLPTRTVTLVRPPSQTKSRYPHVVLRKSRNPSCRLCAVRTRPRLSSSTIPPPLLPLLPRRSHFPFTPAFYSTHRRTQENYCRPLRLQHHCSALDAALRAPQR